MSDEELEEEVFFVIPFGHIILIQSLISERKDMEMT
jgi:hypothetical protein